MVTLYILLCLIPFFGPSFFVNVDVRNVLVAVSDMRFSCCLEDNLCFKSLLGLSASACSLFVLPPYCRQLLITSAVQAHSHWQQEVTVCLKGDQLTHYLCTKQLPPEQKHTHAHTHTHTHTHTRPHIPRGLSFQLMLDPSIICPSTLTYAPCYQENLFSTVSPIHTPTISPDSVTYYLHHHSVSHSFILALTAKRKNNTLLLYINAHC